MGKGSMNLFEVIDAVGHTKRDVLREGEIGESDYNAFMTNRAFSYSPDTVHYANEMNRYPDLPRIVQYDFYRLAVPARRRRGRWGKVETNDRVEAIMAEYDYNRRRAEEVLAVLTDEQVDGIVERRREGGKSR